MHLFKTLLISFATAAAVTALPKLHPRAEFESINTYKLDGDTLSLLLSAGAVWYMGRLVFDPDRCFKKWENRYHDSPLEDNYGKKLKTLQKEWREICQSWQTALEAEKQYAQATQKVKQNNRVALPARRKQDVTKNNYQPQTFRGPTLPASALSPGSAAAAAAGSLVTAPFWGRAAGAMTDAATRATGLFLRGSAPGMVSAGGS